MNAQPRAPRVVVTTRYTPSGIALMNDVAAAKGITRSALVRTAVHEYLQRNPAPPRSTP